MKAGDAGLRNVLGKGRIGLGRGASGGGSGAGEGNGYGGRSDRRGVACN